VLKDPSKYRTMIAGIFGGPLKTYEIFHAPTNGTLAAMASNIDGWEHVSVSLKNRCPNWPEMSFIKDLFWDEEDQVVQYHPPKSEYVNCHPHCLHLWRPLKGSVLSPPKELVGGGD